MCDFYYFNVFDTNCKTKCSNLGDVIVFNGWILQYYPIIICVWTKLEGFLTIACHEKYWYLEL